MALQQESTGQYTFPDVIANVIITIIKRQSIIYYTLYSPNRRRAIYAVSNWMPHTYGSSSEFDTLPYHSPWQPESDPLYSPLDTVTEPVAEPE